MWRHKLAWGDLRFVIERHSVTVACQLEYVCKSILAKCRVRSLISYWNKACFIWKKNHCWLQSSFLSLVPLLIRSPTAALIGWFLENCRATLRVSIPCAGTPLVNISCLSAKTQWRCGLWMMRAMWTSLTAVVESSIHALSTLHIHPCLSLDAIRQVTSWMPLPTIHPKLDCMDLDSSVLR